MHWNRLSVCFLIPFLICLCAKKPDFSPQDRTIDPLVRVGAVTPASTEEDLVRIYGTDHVRRIKLHAGEGEFVDATVLFSGSPDSITIEWKEPYRHPLRITIQSAESWKTDQGIMIGSTLEQVERINGAAFEITGFGWDYGGRSLEWGGTLPIQLQMDFAPADSASEESLMSVTGDEIFLTDNPDIRSLKLRVIRIFIRWDLSGDSEG